MYGRVKDFTAEKFWAENSAEVHFGWRQIRITDNTGYHK